MAKATSYPTDAFIVQTPQLNNLANQMYQEQRFREQTHYNESKALDNDINRELFKVKSADTAGILDKYQKYKDIKKQLYTDHKVQNDPKLFNAVQQQANAALQDIYSHINASAEDKKNAQDLFSAWKAHPDQYATNFGDLIKARLNTPLEGLQNHQFGDLTNPDTYKYKGNLTNLQPHFQKAAGAMRELNQVQGVTPDKQQNTVTTYKGMNNPYDYYNNLVGGLVGSNATKDFLSLYGQMPPDQQQLLEQQYQQLKQNPNFKTAYNIPENQDFPVTAYTTDVGKAARLMAMQHAINNVPVSNITYHNIPSARDAAVLKRQQIMEGIRQNHAVARIQLRHELSQLDAQDQAKYIGSLYDQMKKDAQSGNANLSTISSVKNIFSYKNDKGHPVEPNEVKYNDDGNVQAVFYKKDPNTGETLMEDGKPVIDKEHTTTIRGDEFKVRWSKNLLGTTAAKNVATKKEAVTHKRGLLDDL